MGQMENISRALDQADSRKGHSGVQDFLLQKHIGIHSFIHSFIHTYMHASMNMHALCLTTDIFGFFGVTLYV